MTSVNSKPRWMLYMASKTANSALQAADRRSSTQTKGTTGLTLPDNLTEPFREPSQPSPLNFRDGSCYSRHAQLESL